MTQVANGTCSTNEPCVHEVDKVKETLFVFSLLSSPVHSLNAEVSIVVAKFPIDMLVLSL